MKFSERTERLLKEIVKKNEHLAKVGDGATEYVGSDRYAYTIVKVSSEILDLGDDGDVKAHKWIDIQKDKVEVYSGNFQDGTAMVEFKRGNGEIIRAYFHKPSNNYRMGKRTLKITNGGFEYVDSGRTDKHQPIVKVGYREYYQDPHF